MLAVNHIRRAAAVWLLAAVTTIGAAHAQTPEPLDIRTGVYRGRSVTYQVINGLAVVEGDIILGTPEELEPPKGPQVIKEPDARKEAVATSAPERLWPDGVVPYVIDSNLPEPRRVLNAIQHWNNNTLIQFVERTNEPNWITFEKPGEPICASSVGMAGGEQSLSLGDGCSVGAVIHEIGHAVGFWHEQQREDRDNHVNVLFDNIDKRRTLANFTQFIMTSDDIGPYNYGSIMHYSAYAFTRNNLPSIETIPPGMVIGEADGLSAGDIDGVNRLYGQTPTKTTISTNPPELQIRVDGMVFTAPQSFDWSPGTSHTISVPSPQGDNSERFLFGKWSDGGNQTHNVIAASSTTVFTAHFIQQFKIVTGAFPPESGTVTITPFPPGGFYTARTPVEVTAYPAEGFSFGIWLQPNVRLHGFSGNPARFPVRFPRLLNYTATFTQARPTTIAANFPGLRVVVDGLTWSLPLNFYWSVGTTHTIGVEDAVQVGPSGVSRWVFKEWSDGGAVTHNITVSEDVSTFTADFTKQYLLSTLALPPDGGSIEVFPVHVTASTTTERLCRSRRCPLPVSSCRFGSVTYPAQTTRSP